MWSQCPPSRREENLREGAKHGTWGWGGAGVGEGGDWSLEEQFSNNSVHSGYVPDKYS